MISREPLDDVWLCRLHQLRREPGTSLRACLEGVRIERAWREAERAGLVRMICEPEEDYSLDGREDELQGLRPSEIKRYIAEERKLVEREGVWYYATEFRAFIKDGWELAEGLGWVIGSIEGHGEDWGLKEAALKGLDEAFQREAERLSERATFAG